MAALCNSGVITSPEPKQQSEILVLLGAGTFPHIFMLVTEFWREATNEKSSVNDHNTDYHHRECEGQNSELKLSQVR